MIPLGIMNMTTTDPQNAFRALADPTRRQILIHLASRDMTIGEVTDQFQITRGAIKKHLTILEQGQLISVHVQGRERVNRLQPEGLRSASEWLDHFSQVWDQKLANLKRVIESEQEQ